MYIAKVSKNLGPETIIVTRTGERIDWFTCENVRVVIQNKRFRAYA